MSIKREATKQPAQNRHAVRARPFVHSLARLFVRYSIYFVHSSTSYLLQSPRTLNSDWTYDVRTRYLLTANNRWTRFASKNPNPGRYTEASAARYIAMIRVVIDNRCYLICGCIRLREIIGFIRARYFVLVSLFLCGFASRSRGTSFSVVAGKRKP